MILRYMVLYKNNTRTTIKVWFADNSGKFRRFAAFDYRWSIHRKLIDRQDNQAIIQQFNDALIVTHPITIMRTLRR